MVAAWIGRNWESRGCLRTYAHRVQICWRSLTVGVSRSQIGSGFHACWTRYAKNRSGYRARISPVESSDQLTGVVGDAGGFFLLVGDKATSPFCGPSPAWTG